MARYIDKTGNTREIDFDAIAKALRERDAKDVSSTSDWFFDFDSRTAKYDPSVSRLDLVRMGYTYDDEISMWVLRPERTDDE